MREERTNPKGPHANNEHWDYVYDGKNQLRRVTKKLNGVVQGSEEYWYDADNSRTLIVTRNASGAKTGARWFIGDTEAEYDATGNVTRAFGHVSIGTPVARFDRSSDAAAKVEYQFHGVASNTIGAVAQETGTINASSTYAPFGEIVEATNSGGASAGLASHRRRMNDKFVDDISRLAYYGYRYYDAMSMMWTQSDPLYRFEPDSAWDEPRRADLYMMSLNNPLRFVDPDGRSNAALVDAFVTGFKAAAATGGETVAVGALGLAGVGVAVAAAGLWLQTKTGAYGPGVHVKHEEAYDRAALEQVRTEKTIEYLAEHVEKDIPATEEPSTSYAVSQRETGERLGTAGGERAGKKFTPAGKKLVKEDNRARNGGKMKCENKKCGREVKNAGKSQKGKTPPGNEAHVDHIISKDKGGDGSAPNGQVLCRRCNLDKSNKQ